MNDSFIESSVLGQLIWQDEKVNWQGKTLETQEIS